MSFSIDMDAPNIILISPVNDAIETGSNSITFVYNVVDAAVANCSLMIDNSIDQVDLSITENIEQTFSKALSNGIYNWSISCRDEANLENTSLMHGITTNVSSGDGSGSGSGGSSGSSGGSGGGSSGGTDETFDEPAEQIKPVEEPAKQELPASEEKNESEIADKVINEQNTNETTSNAKEKLPLTGRVTSLVKGAVKPKNITLGVIATGTMAYVIFRVFKRGNKKSANLKKVK